MNKHIEEMAKEIRKYICTHLNCQCCECEELHTAERLYNAGYRKSTDVARDIFEEIEENYADFLFDGHRNIIVLTEKDFAELKKKYESEGAE